MTSALLRNGPDHLRPLEVQVRDWMDEHGFETVGQLRGRLSQRSVPNPAAFERANYIKTLASHAASGRQGPARAPRSAAGGGEMPVVVPPAAEVPSDRRGLVRA